VRDFFGNSNSVIQPLDIVEEKMVQKHEELIPMTPLKDIYVGPPVEEAVPEQNLA